MMDMYRQTQGSPFGAPGGGFFPPFPPQPGFPGGGQNRIDRLEREVNRLQNEVDRLDRRLRRVERRLGF